jgi:hypothetical protein
LRCDHPIRRAAGRARVDRGGALYLARAPAEGFLCEPRGDGWALTPGEALVRAFAAWALPRAGDDALVRALLPVGGGAEDAPLLLEGIKLIDLAAPESALAAYERRLRRRAAVRLREKKGGGLLALCAACLAIARQGLTKQ